jgi:hypothetical protein
MQADPKEGFVFKSKLKEVNFFLPSNWPQAGEITEIWADCGCVQGQKKFSGQLATNFR